MRACIHVVSVSVMMTNVASNILKVIQFNFIWKINVVSWVKANQTLCVMLPLGRMRKKMAN